MEINGLHIRNSFLFIGYTVKPWANNLSFLGFSFTYKIWVIELKANCLVLEFYLLFFVRLKGNYFWELILRLYGVSQTWVFYAKLMSLKSEFTDFYSFSNIPGPSAFSLLWSTNIICRSTLLPAMPADTTLHTPFAVLYLSSSNQTSVMQLTCANPGTNSTFCKWDPLGWC